MWRNTPRVAVLLAWAVGQIWHGLGQILFGLGRFCVVGFWGAHLMLGCAPADGPMCRSIVHPLCQATSVPGGAFLHASCNGARDVGSHRRVRSEPDASPIYWDSAQQQVGHCRLCRLQSELPSLRVDIPGCVAVAIFILHSALMRLRQASCR